MMRCYFVDAFAERVFEGNPAGVCVMENWPSEALMQAIAVENNLSETAFAVKEGDSYRLRWFMLTGEIDLCGHATLATAFTILNYVEPDQSEIRFQTMSGELIVNRSGDLYEIDFPAFSLTRTDVSDLMEQVIGFRPVEAWMGRDLVCVLESEEQVRSVVPDLQKALELDGLLLHVTAPATPGTEFDCVTRSFAPKTNVAEDPVCGSGHCHVVPLWAKKLDKQSLVARQASKRGGTLYCKVQGGRVTLAGKAALYATAELNV